MRRWQDRTDVRDFAYGDIDITTGMKTYRWSIRVYKNDGTPKGQTTVTAVDRSSAESQASALTHNGEYFIVTRE
ncbi:hypothetical protein LCGC14_0593350 [marine sediment metagenome]|uniref:Uncharacterized protein n=1 Tax=marine sediment metagenome TaxID=412755 RepID=A0A0F9RWP0_9ZZZZ